MKSSKANKLTQPIEGLCISRWWGRGLLSRRLMLGMMDRGRWGSLIKTEMGSWLCGRRKNASVFCVNAATGYV